jgi:hypothetical protein
MSDRRPMVKIIAESLSQHDEIHVVSTLLGVVKVGERKSLFYILGTVSQTKK